MQEGFTCSKDNNFYDLGAKAVYEWAWKDCCYYIGSSMFLDISVTCSLLYDIQLCFFCNDQLSKQASAISWSLPMPVLSKTPFIPCYQVSLIVVLSFCCCHLIPSNNLTSTPAPMTHKQQTPQNVCLCLPKWLPILYCQLVTSPIILIAII